MNRQEHVAWCKQRALEYVEAGDVNMAFTSLLSDLNKHPDTESTAGVVAELGGMLLLGGHLATPGEMRAWINGVG